MKILAMSVKGKEYLYSKNKAIKYPSYWTDDIINRLIPDINKALQVEEGTTYHIHEIDQYDNVYPMYQLYNKNKQIKLREI